MKCRILKIHAGLGVKFVILIVVILSVTLGGSTLHYVHSQNNLFQDQLEEKGRMLGHFVSLISSDAILGYDFITLNDFMKEITHQKDMVYGVILDNEGKNMTSFLDQDNPIIAETIKNIGTNDILKVIALLQGRNDILPKEFPIMFNGKEKIGSVLVGMSKERLSVQSRDALIEHLTWNLAIIVFLSACIYYVFRFNALRPIKCLIQGSERIAKGDLSKPVRMFSDDELGCLSQSFNQMMEKLAATITEKDDAMQQLQELNKYLEDRVNKRTIDLARSETRLRAIIENIGEGVIVIDDHGHIESINPAAERIFGFTSDQVKGIHSVLLLAEKHLEKIDNKDFYQDEVDGPFQPVNIHQPVEYEGQRANGSTFPMELVVTPMVLGERRMRVCIARDISQRKETELSLADAQKQLLDAAHKSGMADMATGVLHNIGNILNSVNLSAKEISRLAQDSNIKGLQKANALLETHMEEIDEFLTRNERGKLLPSYYVKLGRALEEEINKIASEAHLLNEKTRMMQDVISTQQEYAGTGYYSEALEITSIIEDAVRVEESSLIKWGIHLTRKYRDVPLCEVQKTKLLQVITNLIKNAKEAMLQNDVYGKPKEFNIEIGIKDENFAFIKIIDNGCGIEKDNLTKVFSHGFTTKQTGHGFGLHFSANAMIEMGGSLSVSSEGVQKGCQFIITVPVARLTPMRKTKPRAAHALSG